MAHQIVLFCLLVLLSFLQSAHARLEGSVINVYNIEGNAKAYFDDTVDSPCETVLFLGVGTMMTVTDYSDISQNIVDGKSIVVIVVDSNPSKIQKQDVKMFATFLNEIEQNLSEYVRICSKTQMMKPRYLVGGHSASGEASIKALPYLSFYEYVVGFVGLSPYVVPTDERINVPSIFWGFSNMSCFVSPESASARGYEISNTMYRVFYQLQTNNWNVATGGSHCGYADNGCHGMCMGDRPEQFRRDVAKTIHLFVEAVSSPTIFNRGHFEQALPNSTNLYVNDDEL